MFLAVAIILGVAWLLGLTLFHAAGFAIHILLLFAVISVIVYLVSGIRPRPSRERYSSTRRLTARAGRDPRLLVK